MQAPGLRAVEAFGRADSIITQIDQEIRAQQASALVRKTPSPLNPANWTLAMTEAASVVKNIVTEVHDNWTKNGGMSGFTQALPGIAARVVVLGEVGSTNTYLVEEARAQAHAWPLPSLVVADHQTQGRGRLDRAWQTPPHTALTCSLLLAPGTPRDTW